MKMQQMWMNIKENTRTAVVKTAAVVLIVTSGCSSPQTRPVSVYSRIATPPLQKASQIKALEEPNKLQVKLNELQGMVPLTDSLEALCKRGEYAAFYREYERADSLYQIILLQYQTMRYMIENNVQPLTPPSNEELREHAEEMKHLDYEIKEAKRTYSINVISLQNRKRALENPGWWMPYRDSTDTKFLELKSSNLRRSFEWENKWRVFSRLRDDCAKKATAGSNHTPEPPQPESPRLPPVLFFPRGFIIRVDSDSLLLKTPQTIRDTMSFPVGTSLPEFLRARSQVYEREE